MEFNKVSRTFWSLVKVGKKNAPIIEAIVGTALVVGGVTALILSAEDIADVNRKVKDAADEIKAADNDEAGWDEMDETKSHYIFRTVKECSIGYVKSAGVGVGLTSLGLIFNGLSTIEFTRQVETATVMAAGIYTSYNQYRQRVIADQGAEKDFEYYTGCGVTKTVELQKDGTTVTTVKPIKINPDECHVPFSFSFTESQNANHTWSADANLNFLYGALGSANRYLDRKGYITYNKICELFGARESVMGACGGARLNWPDGTVEHHLRINPIGIQDMIDGISTDGLIMMEYDDGTPLDFNIFEDPELIGLHNI